MSHMPVSPVDTERQNAAASAPYVDIAQTSRLLVSTQMGNGTESRSELRKFRNPMEHTLTGHRQFGTMTEKLADYEKLLKDLLSRVGDEDASLIRASLEKVRKPLLVLAFL